jgi:hypothetical protein
VNLGCFTFNKSGVSFFLRKHYNLVWDVSLSIKAGVSFFLRKHYNLVPLFLFCHPHPVKPVVAKKTHVPALVVFFPTCRVPKIKCVSVLSPADQSIYPPPPAPTHSPQPSSTRRNNSGRFWKLREKTYLLSFPCIMICVNLKSKLDSKILNWIGCVSP